ncbi:hypothetical protein F5Y06DRAFT_304342 [Hypoxylon sp. FL0890]|nr:hypothetical protein F5Y06DRAFT_304342 [Hypoxylon sp. FL0890]
MDYYQDLRPSGTLPYPDLIKGYGSTNQQAYFMEPANEVGGFRSGNFRRTMEEKGTETAVAKQFPKFGSLSHHYQMRREGGGWTQLVFYRRNRGTVEHGLGRTGESTFECAKYNILRHARQDDSNNPNYAEKDQGLVTGMDQAMLNLANYPFVSHTVMSAPLLPRRVPLLASHTGEKTGVEGQFSIPQKEQPKAMTNAFRNPELCLKLLFEIAGRWDDLGNLTRTCQMVMFAVNQVSTHVDLTKGNFLNLNFSDEDVKKANERLTAEDIAENGKFIVPGSPAFLVLSNIRGRYRGAEDGEEAPDHQGYPAPPKGRYFRPTAERKIIDTSFRLLSTINMRGPQIRILHFHSTQHLDLSVLKMCLDNLPELKVLGIHNCELLHFGMTVPLLEAIIERNKNPDMSFVRCDFSPFYYYGRQRQDDGRKGEYGVIPSDMGTVDTRRAVTAVLRTAVPLAVENGIDWFTPGTGFRKFLDRLPFSLGSVRYILEALFNIDYFERGLYDTTVDDRWRDPVEQAAFDAILGRTLHSDLVLAVHGKAMEKSTLEATMTLRGDFHLVTCAFCKAELPSYLYAENSAYRRADQIQCSGCQLRTLLDHQIDNFFQEKKQVVRRLFDDPRITDLASFLNAKRVATQQEIDNPLFPFYDLAVKTRTEVYVASSDGLVLDGRPSPNHPAETKEIWVWRERVMRAMKYARVHIDDGPRQAQEVIARCRRRIDRLNAAYINGNLRGQFQIKRNRDKVDDLMRYIDQELARCGQGQMGGRHGTVLAADWDSEISKYRQFVQAQAGVVENQGPYNTVWNNTRTGFW